MVLGEWETDRPHVGVRDILCLGMGHLGIEYDQLDLHYVGDLQH